MCVCVCVCVCVCEWYHTALLCCAHHLWPLLSSFLFRLIIFFLLANYCISTLFIQNPALCSFYNFFLEKKMLLLLFTGSICSSILIWVSEKWHNWQNLLICFKGTLNQQEYTTFMISFKSQSSLRKKSPFLITWKK